MPVVAIIDGIRIELYTDEHPPPRFHARYGEHVSQIEIGSGRVLKGSRPIPQARKVLDLGPLADASPDGSLGDSGAQAETREDRVNDIVPMTSVEPVLYGVLKIMWHDGYVALVDLRPVISDGAMFSFLRDEPANFGKVRLNEHGHRIVWNDAEGDEIDFGSDGLRKRAERQSEILRLAS